MAEIKTLGQFINHLATKAGIPADDQNLLNILSNSELSKATVHSDLVKSIDENLLSIEVAKENHPTLKNHYQAQALNALDRKMEDVMTAAGLDATVVTELKNVKSSYARLELLQTKLQEQYTAKAKEGQKPEDKTALQKQVDDLLLKLNEADATKNTEISTIKTAHQQEKQAYELRGLLSGVKTKYDELPPKTRNASIMEHIEKELQTRNAKFDFDENGQFTILNEDGTAFIGANHSKYTPQSFIGETLAQEKVLVVSNPPKQETKKTSVEAGPDAPKGNNQKVRDLNAEALAALGEEA